MSKPHMGQPANDDWDDVDDQPRGEVQRIGRWTYLVSVRRELTTYGPGASGWPVLGRRRAERKAARVLAHYMRDEKRAADVTIVEAES